MAIMRSDAPSDNIQSAISSDSRASAAPLSSISCSYAAIAACVWVAVTGKAVRQGQRVQHGQVYTFSGGWHGVSGIAKQRQVRQGFPAMFQWHAILRAVQQRHHYVCKKVEP